MESKPSYRTTSPDIKSERKMTTIELKEYEEKKESELQGLDLVGFRNYLNRQKLSSVIDVYSNSIKSSQWVGVIKYKKTIIQILPKLICD